MRDQDGNPFRIVTLPMPPAAHYEGQRLPASYANFYIANGVVLLPAYDPTTDEIARQTCSAASDPPGHPARFRDLIWGWGHFTGHPAMASPMKAIEKLVIGNW
jgi:agmatine deiminase